MDKKEMEIRAKVASGYYERELEKMWKLKDYIPKDIFSLPQDSPLRANKACGKNNPKQNNHEKKETIKDRELCEQ